MNLMKISSFFKPLILFAVLCLLAAPAVLAQRADPRDPKNVELGVELLQKAAAARGGERYKNFRSILTVGQFTKYDKGMSQVPTQFTDWIVYPDKERTEFGKGKKKDRLIQVNTGKNGWVYDGDAETLKDQTDQQVQSYLDGIQFDIDRILRGSWKDAGGEAKFWGREELRPGERANVVEIKLKNDTAIYMWLDRNTNLPMNLIYEKTEEGRLVKRETRYNQYIDYDGVKFANIVDFYRDGVQEGRINLQSVKLDPPITDDLFAKPASVKAIK
jgi:hypothetical protein